MSTARTLSVAVASVATSDVSGRYYRLTSKKRVKRAFDGSPAGGRWGRPGAFPVIYLADSFDACVIEAYRHAAEDTDPPVQPRGLGLIGCDVDVTQILDLTRSSARYAVGLSDPAVLFSEPQDPDTGVAYQACQAVAQAAHQLGRHGILVPSATQRGNTLALFADHLPLTEVPVSVGGVGTWESLPPDPRRPRLVRPSEA